MMHGESVWALRFRCLARVRLTLTSKEGGGGGQRTNATNDEGEKEYPIFLVPNKFFLRVLDFNQFVEILDVDITVTVGIKHL
jgi:hypothetical protein